MCGIICLIKYGGAMDKNVASQCHQHLEPRGPDKQHHEWLAPNIYMGFSRLSIMDTSDNGLQPFKSDAGNYAVCNGEIYNFQELAKAYNINMTSHCDCEVILPLYEKVGFEAMIKNLDAEFAILLFDKASQTIYAARDRYGVRPLFYGYNSSTNIFGFASEMKALHDIMEYVEPVVPNTYIRIRLGQNDVSHDTIGYYDYAKLIAYPDVNSESYIKDMINDLFTQAVKKRLHSDRPIGFLLSGGLDSSLIVAIATRILGPDNIVCFSIGLETSPDVVASKVVTSYLGIIHHHIIPFDIEAGFNAIPEVIRMIESYDITTIRASVPQYLMAKYINTYTDIRVLLSGEGSDEIHGSYRYFRDAPNAAAFHQETIRLLKELYMFDNLRTDRTMSGNGLEVRVPFLDYEYVEFIKRIDPSLLMYRQDYMEKKIIRDSFVGYLPDEILYRSKEAFSDAVSSTEVNWFKTIQTRVAETISDEELMNTTYEFNTPKTKDALYFRNIFSEIYPGRENVIAHYWLPKFQADEVHDPSATVLKCY